MLISDRVRAIRSIHRLCQPLVVLAATLRLGSNEKRNATYDAVRV